MSMKHGILVLTALLAACGDDSGPGNACDNHGTTVAGCVSAIRIATTRLN